MERTTWPTEVQVVLVLARCFPAWGKKNHIKNEPLSLVYMLFPPEGWRGMAGEPANSNVGVRQTQSGNS